MEGQGGAPCAYELKKMARLGWEEKNHHDWIVMGYVMEEQDRHDRFVLEQRDTLLPILIEDRITKEMCYRIIQDAGIKLPRIYSMGYPNANCIGCVKATSPTYWNHVRKMHPDVFEARAEQSRRMGKDGARLVRYKGKRIFLDELPPDAKGDPMKNMDIECGLFCMEELK